jgi:hypothetical protein
MTTIKEAAVVVAVVVAIANFQYKKTQYLYKTYPKQSHRKT